MSAKPITTLILGTGAHGLHAAAVLQRQGTPIGGFLSEDSDQVGTTLIDLPVLGSCHRDEVETQWHGEACSFFVAVWQKNLYAFLCELFYDRLCNAIDPAAVIGPGLQIGRNVLIEACAVLGPQLHIDHGCWIQPHARLGAGVALRSEVIIGGGATLGEGVEIGAGAYVGPQSYVAPRLQVGAGAQIAPLSSLLTAVPAGAHIAEEKKNIS